MKNNFFISDDGVPMGHYDEIVANLSGLVCFMRSLQIGVLFRFNFEINVA